MPNTSAKPSNSLFTILLVVVLIVSLFPGFPQYLLWLPFSYLPLIGSGEQVSPYPISSCPPGCRASNITTSAESMSWFQKSFTLPPHARGSYLITDHVLQNLPEIKTYKVGILHLFVQHTSCGLSLNENWDSDVRVDMSDALDRLVPEDHKGDLYRHSCEGPDDMPVGFFPARLPIEN
jgi:Uncharacterised protein family UPF0047